MRTAVPARANRHPRDVPALRGDAARRIDRRTPLPRPRHRADGGDVPVPPIPACRAWATRYAGEHGPPLDLTQAVPGWAPHPDMLAALARAAGDPAAATYGLLEGETALREALAEDMRLLYGGDVSAEDLRITAGANIGFTLAMTVLAAPGDEVLLPAPWFFNHEMALALRGVRAVPLPCRAADGFLPDPERAAALVGPRTRAIVLVTPNNPTGAVMPPALIGRFAELCRARGLWLVLDETYRDFLPEEQDAPHALFRRPDWRDFVVQLYSFSKAYCIPGHRVGAVCRGAGLPRRVREGGGQHPDLPAAAAAIRAGLGGAGLARMARRQPRAHRGAGGGVPAHPGGGRAGMADRRDRRLFRLGARAGAERRTRPRWRSGWRVERGVVSLPGGVFGPGGERHIRLAFANTDEDTIAEVPRRLAGLFAGAPAAGGEGSRARERSRGVKEQSGPCRAAPC